MKKILAALAVTVTLLTGTAQGVEWSSINRPYYEIINEQTFSPPDPMTSYGFKEDVPWTMWNRVLFTSAIGANAVDIASTQDGLDRGCEESNPIYGDDPSVGTMVIIKVVAMGVTYYLVENYTPIETRQQWRNWAYGAHTLVGGAAAIHNYNTDCY